MVALNTITSLFPFFSLAIAATNLHSGSRHSGRPHSRRNWRTISRSANTTTKRSDATYTLQDKHSGNSFFDGWTYFTQDDPTHGQVNYVSQDDAQSKNLTFVQPDGTAVLAVDDYTHLVPGQKRNSVRVTSKKTYDQGLFIMDVFAMPHGCSVWPAWWTVGPNWPHGGEIDIVEGVHENQFNQYTLHTSDGCSLDRTPPKQGAGNAFTSKVLGTTCASSNGNNDGCAFLDSNSNSYGHEMNLGAGGVFAMLWDGEGIKIWHWPRGSIPADVQAFKPAPTTWQTPAAFWSSSTCSTGEFFKDHAMVIDTTLCGDWAGATFSSAGCPGTCSDYIQDPSHFALAKWKINYVAAYTAS